MSILFILEKIGPNDLVGIRVGKALRNEDNWYKVHTFAGWTILITSILSLLFLITLQLLKRYYTPDLDIQPLAVTGSVISMLLGDALIPAVYSIKMPDGSNNNETTYDRESFASKYAVLVYVWVSVILILFTAPMAFNKAEPNGSYGVKTSITRSSEENWYRINEFFGWSMIIACCVSIILVLFVKYLFIKDNKSNKNDIILFLVFLAPLVISFIVSNIYMIDY